MHWLTDGKQKTKMNRQNSTYAEFLTKLPDTATYEKPTQEKINDIRNEFRSLFNVGLPDDYIEFLHFTNGLSYDGRSICGVYDEVFLAEYPRKKSMDIIRSNSSFRDTTDITDYILLGKSSIDHIVYNISEKKYQILSNGTMERFGSFDSFIELLYSFYDV